MSTASVSHQSDVYSFGIVMWEVINCIVTQHYEVPYSNIIKEEIDLLGTINRYNSFNF